MWMELLPLAHAYTIFIATLVKSDSKNATLDDAEILQKAWTLQLTGTPSVLMDIDVDRDCLYQLEEEMFERSSRAGIAGHCQWGLDEGDHQLWNPYDGIPEHWIHRDRDDSDGELEVSRVVCLLIRC